jgi:hypothetical protein
VAGEKKSCVAATAPSVGCETGGGGPARVPPVDGEAAPVALLGALGASAICVGSAAGAAGVSDTVNGVTSLPGEAGAPGDAPAGSASAPQVQFQTQFQPERAAPVCALRHAPLQVHTQVQVSGTPGGLAELGEAVTPGALAPLPEALAAGALAPVGLAVTPGALTPLMLAVTPGARAVSGVALAASVLTPASDALTPGTLTLLAETLAAGRLSCLAGAGGVCADAAAGVAAASWEADAAGAEAPPSVGADVPEAAVAPPLAAAALLVLVCVTAPSSPGLFTRTATLTLAGPACALPALALTPPGALALPPLAAFALTPPAALAPALLACVTEPFSPGLSTRTETFTLAGCACCATAAPVAAATAAVASSARAAGAKNKTTMAANAPRSSVRRSRSWAPVIGHPMPPRGARVPCNHR